MFLSTNKGMSAPIGSQPCLKKAMQMMTTTQNKDGFPVQCHICVHSPMCRAVLKNVTPPNPYISEKVFSHKFQKHTPPAPYVMTCLHVKAKHVKNPNKCTKLAAYECPQEICNTFHMIYDVQLLLPSGVALGTLLFSFFGLG